MLNARSPIAAGFYEPSMQLQFLKGCACGAPHPIVLKSPDPTICPQCGMSATPPGRVKTVPAVLTGRSPSALAARFCFWAARKFSNLLKELDR